MDRKKLVTYSTFLAMTIAACCLVYLSLSHIPRQKYILESILEEKANKLLLERQEFWQNEVVAEISQAFARLNPSQLESLATTVGTIDWIHTAFLLDSELRLVFPQVITQTQWEERELAEELSGMQIFQQGERHEYADSPDYGQASKFYQLALQKVTSPLLHVEILNALVACQLREKEYLQAAQNARQISAIATENTLNPYWELVGWYQYGQATIAVDQRQGVDILLRLYSRIVEREIALARPSQYTHWEKSLANSITAKGDERQRNRLSQWQKKSQMLREQEQFTIFLQKISQQQDSFPLVGETGIQHQYFVGKRPYLLLYQPVVENGKKNVIGVLVDLQGYQKLLGPLLEDSEEFIVALLSNQTIASLTDTIQADVPLLAQGSLAGWRGISLAVYQRNPSDFARKIRQEMWFSLLLTGLVALLLFFGVYYTFRSFLREMELSRLKSDFVACISHELRTPLALIQSYGETLCMGRVREDQRQRYYQVIVKETERLGYLIKNILNLARIESGRLDLRYELVETASVARKLVADSHIYWPDYQGKISLDLETLPKVAIDPTAIHSALFNLLDNAIKYGENSDITVSVRRENGELCLSVQDRGAGIDAEEQKKIFSVFYRGAGKKSIRGIGLGLTMVQHIAHAHGGRVIVESLRQQGSLFQVRIPWRERIDDES